MNSEFNSINHSNMQNINLEHVRAFVAVSEYGGVNIAAEKLYKSPSTISHALGKLQEQLSLKLFEQQGRRLHLTEQGVVILKQAKILLDEKQTLLGVAAHLQQGYRAEIMLAADAVCPHEVLLAALSGFSQQFPSCHIKLHEGVLSGAEEQLLNGLANVCIAYRIPQGFLGEHLLDVPFVPVVCASHSMAGQTNISSRQLMAQRQVVIGDSGRQEKVDSGWLKATQRWTVSSMHTAIEVILSGMAFGWVPAHLIQNELASGQLIELHLKFGGEKRGALFISLADEECKMSGALAGILKTSVAVWR